MHLKALTSDQLKRMLLLSIIFSYEFTIVNMMDVDEPNNALEDVNDHLRSRVDSAISIQVR